MSGPGHLRLVRRSGRDYLAARLRQPIAAVLGLIVLAAALGIPTLARLDVHDSGWGTFAVLVSLGITAQLLVARADRERSHQAAVVVAISAAALLLPPGLVVLAAAFLYVPRGLQNTRTPWPAQAFEVSTAVLGGLAAWGAAHTTETLTSSILTEETSWSLAALAACLALAGAFRAPRIVVERLQASRSEGARWALPAAGTATELLLAALGVVLAAMWVSNQWLVPFAVAPLFLVQRSFRIPRLEEQTLLDPKTGLFNARHLDAALERELGEARLSQRSLSVIIVDLDLLREINNAHGHLAGDAVLRGVSDILREYVRPTDVPCRFGGEEFAVILPATAQAKALEIAERLRRTLAQATFRSAAGVELRATLSAGVATFPEHGGTATELIHLADLALYRAKLQGRNRVLSASADPLASAPPGPRLVAISAAESMLELELGESPDGSPTSDVGAPQDRAAPAKGAPAGPVGLLIATGATGAIALAVALGVPRATLLLAFSALCLAVATLVAVLRTRRVSADSAAETERRAEVLWRAADTLRTHNASLERANRLLRERSAAAMETLSAVIDARDSNTAGHSRRVQRLAVEVGRELGLSEAELEVLGHASRFHDLGKLAVPDAILLKPARLDLDEWRVMRGHPDEGAKLIERLGFLGDALPAIRHHHERYDGSGYPDGLAAEEIPLGARIIHLVDALDAMLTSRVYRSALAPAEALDELRRGTGTQFCPRCLDALDRIMLAELADGADVPAELLAG